MATFPNVFQPMTDEALRTNSALKGHWHDNVFHNAAPIVLELGCGKGEYTVGLARRFKNVNFIGVDIKGARMWTGAKQALDENLSNAAFLRTRIEFIDSFFAHDEVDEIWLTFSDPQMKMPTKRLTSTYFLERYRNLLRNNGIIHVKTDSNFLFTYTEELLKRNDLTALLATRNLYSETALDQATRDILNIRTYYEQQWIERGIPIKYLKFCLPQNGKLTEPEIEIPLDDYRSFHRPKRSGNEKHI